MLLTILHDHRTINIATVIIGTIAGLYASYSGLLGRPSGVLRQLLVGIPLGVIGGLLCYLLDVNNTFSNILKELIQSPAIPSSSITFGIIGGATCLAIPLIYPDSFRGEGERQGVSTPNIVTGILLSLFAAVLGTFWGFIGILTLFKLLNPWLHFYPPLLGVIGTAFILTIIPLFFARADLGLVQPRNTGNMTIPVKILILITQISKISIVVYAILVLRWSTLVYFGIALAAFLPLFPIQYGADHLSEKSLQVISLVLFAVAAALQLYQAMAL